MVFVLYLREKQNNQVKKQIKQSLDWLKDLSKKKQKKQLKNNFYIIKLKFSEDFGENNLFNWGITLKSRQKFR